MTHGQPPQPGPDDSFVQSPLDPRRERRRATPGDSFVQSPLDSGRGRRRLKPNDSFVQTSLDPQRSAPLTTRKLLTLVSLGLALLVALGGTALLLQRMPDQTTRAVTGPPKIAPTATYPFTFLPTYTPAPPPTDTPPPPPTATPTQLPYPAPGWTAAGPGSASSIAFAPGHPTLAYACGSATNSNLVTLDTSTDGGKTWTTVVTPIQGELCALAVDPTDPQDVAVNANGCAGPCAPSPPWQLYRSRDGGQSWSVPTLPAEPNNAPIQGFGPQFGFAGGALIATAYSGNGRAASNVIAASVNGEAFQWIDTGPDFSGEVQGSLNLDMLLVYGPTVVAVFSASSCPNQMPCITDSTTDAGATWTSMQPTYQNQPVQPIAGAPDGKTLFGNMLPATGQPEPLLVSTDQGATWRAEPQIPNLDAGNVLAAPDGTLVAYGYHPVTGSPNDPLFELKPGSTTWQSIDPGATIIQTITLSAAANGHPLAVWATRGLNPADGGLLTGLEYLPLH